MKDLILILESLQIPNWHFLIFWKCILGSKSTLLDPVNSNDGTGVGLGGITLGYNDLLSHANLNWYLQRWLCSDSKCSWRNISRMSKFYSVPETKITRHRCNLDMRRTKSTCKTLIVFLYKVHPIEIICVSIVWWKISKIVCNQFPSHLITQVSGRGYW